MALNFAPEFVADFLQTVRTRSGYYGQLWQDVPQGVSSVEDLPLTNLEDYWTASREGRLLTRAQFDGMIVRTGGTTSEPKVVHLGRDEIQESLPGAAGAWSTVCGLRAGDRIANLFHIGGMYAGFAKMTLALHHVTTPHIHLPISGNESPPEQANFMQLFKATVIFSNVLTVCRIVDHLMETGQTVDSVRLVLFGGETFYEDLRTSWRKAFPNATARPLMYGAADGGMIGTPVEEPGQKDLDIKPVYQASQHSIVLELLDEEGSVIREPYRKGRIFLTDFKRRLHPVIRYPMGDVAWWTDFERRRFELFGRETVALKVGSVFLGLPKLRKLVSETFGAGLVNSFQCFIRRSEGKNEVTLRFAAPQSDPVAATKLLEEKLIEVVPKWGELLKVGYIQPLKTEWVTAKDLIFSEKSGKLKDIVELRYENSENGVNGVNETNGSNGHH